MNNIAFYLSLLTFALAFALYRAKDILKEECEGQEVIKNDYDNAEYLLYNFCEYHLSSDGNKCRAQSIYDYVNPKINNEYSDIESMHNALCVGEDPKIENQNVIKTVCAISNDVKNDGGFEAVTDPEKKCEQESEK